MGRSSTRKKKVPQQSAIKASAGIVPPAPAPVAAVPAGIKLPVRTDSFPRLILASVFFLSGLCGLMYEVVWTRLLVLVFGSTTHAISTVLAVFMLGLALGSHFFGRRVSRMEDPQKVYGFLEVGIGIYAFLFLPLLYLVQILHSALFPHLYESFLLLSIFRIGLCLLIIIIPTVLMGATIPLIASLLTVSGRSMGRDVGIIYFLNTIGASLGSFLSAFVVIPNFGLNWTLYLGGMLNLAIGAAAIGAGRISPVEDSVPDIPPRNAEEDHTRPGLALFAFFMIGLLSMVYENAWSRALVMVFGTSIYAFATMLTAYLVGLALGSLVFGRIADRLKNHMACFAVLTAVVGLSIFATTPVIGRLPDYFVQIFAKDDAGWAHVTLLEFLVCFAIMLPPTFCSGASFPLVSRICAGMRNFQIGRSVADVYSLNTAGCILGSLATGFLLIPALGVEKSLLFAAAASILLASALLFFSQSGAGAHRVLLKRAAALVLAIAAFAGAWTLPNWDPLLMASGVYVYSRVFARNRVTIEEFMSRYRLLYHKEGPSDTVTVLESPAGSRFLKVNGKTDGSDGGDKYTQTLLGLLPLMYVQNPKTVLDIGLGTGITAGSLLDYPIESIDCAEISRPVVEASNFFSKTNGNALESPRFHLRILDGRTWLMSMNLRYDIITSEPSHPWQTGNANLFTTDFFEMASRRLNDNGILCQWLPYYHMDKEHFRLLLKSLKTVFRNVNIWIANTDALVIASNNPLSLDYAEIKRKMEIESVKNRFHSIGINSVEDFLSFFYIDNDAVDGFIKPIDYVNSDKFPVIEFNAPKYILGAVKPDTFTELMNLSYGSRLILANCSNPAETNENRIKQRAVYFREWFIPDSVADEIIRKSLAAYK